MKLGRKGFPEKMTTEETVADEGRVFPARTANAKALQEEDEQPGSGEQKWKYDKGLLGDQTVQGLEVGLELK